MREKGKGKVALFCSSRIFSVCRIGMCLGTRFLTLNYAFFKGLKANLFLHCQTRFKITFA